jgi:hypothetical protein
MRILGWIVAFLLMAFSVLLFTLSAWNVAIAEALYSPSTYDAVLDDERVFEDLLPVALPALLEAAEQDESFENNEVPVNISDVNEALSREAWRELTGLLVPPEWLQARADQIVSVLLRIVEGDLSALQDSVEFAEVRSRLRGEEADRAVELILNEAPQCTQTQIDRIRTLQAGGDVQLPICRPDDDDLRAFSAEVMRLTFNGLAEVIPDDTLTAGEFYEIASDDARFLYLLGEIDNQSGLLMYLCPMALLSLMVVAVVRSRRSFGRWIGSTSLLAGVVLLITLFMMQALLFSSVTGLFQTNNELEQFAARIFSGIARSMFATSGSVLLVQVAFFVLSGFALLAMSFFGGGDDEDDSLVLITEDGEIISTATQRRSAVQPNNP